MPQAIPYLAYAATSSQLVAFVAAVAIADYQATQAKERARQSAQEAARNRAFTVRSGIAPRKVVLGTMRLGGVVSYGELVGDEQQYLDQVLSIHHGPAETLGVFLDDVYIPATHVVDGLVVAGGGGERSMVYTASLGTASDVINLPYAPNNPAVVTAKHLPDNTMLTVVAVEGRRVVLSVPYTGSIEVHYTTTEDPSDKYDGRDRKMAFGETIITTGTVSSVTLAHLPIAGVVSAVRNSIITTTGDAAGDFPVSENVPIASVVGNVVTFTAPIEGPVEVHYSYLSDHLVPLRVQWTSGSDTQGPTAWADIGTPKWTAQHLQLGVVYVRTLMLTDANIFQQGMPSPSLLLKGAMAVYDPRTSTTVTGATNPALLSAWYATLPRKDGGCGVPSDLVDWVSVATAANICDEMISVRKMDGSGYESIKRYECHTVLSLADAAPEDNLRVILSSMAGDWLFTGGKFKCFAGAFRAASLTITDDDVDGESPIVFAPLNGAAKNPPNTITSRIYSAAANWMETQPREVQNETYVAADGGEISDEIELPATTDERQANYLMGVHLERNRPAQTAQVTLLGVGADVALLDTVQFALTGYEDLAGRTFEVRRRENHWNGKYPIELREVRASTYALDPDRFTAVGGGDGDRDPDLWDVQPVVITDVVNAAQMQADGSTLARAQVQWAEHTQRYVNPRGWIEVRYKAAGGADWTYATPVPGSHVGMFLAPLAVGTVLWIEARARNSVGAISDWSTTPPFAVTGSNDLPPDPTGYGWEIKPAQARVYWDPVAESSLEMELRLGATFASGALRWRGKSTDYKIARPPNGTYRVWMAWRRQIGPGDEAYSAAPAHVDVVVDDTIDGGTGGKLVLEANGNFFAFANATTHTSASPAINFTAHGIGLVGTASWSARAYDALVGGTDIGPVTLTTNGNGATMTAAQFTAPGTSGSVRRAEVTASIGGQVDTRKVYRLDPSVTTPVLWLSDERVVVPADAAGEHPVLTDAYTYAAVYQGNGTTVLDKTNVHTWSLVPDAGITATINGGAGPVVNPASVLVQITGMSIRSGVVKVRATPASGPVLEADFVVDISAADGSGWNAYWQPPSLTLQVDAQGNVTGLESAKSDFAIVDAANGVDDTANWAKSIVCRNVTAELVGARAAILSWLPLGQVTAGSTIPATLHASWTRAGQLIHTAQGNWLQIGYNNSGPWTAFRRATKYDAAPWTDVAVASGSWQFGDASRDGIIVVEVTGSSNRYLYSTDDGLTFNVGTFPTGVQRKDLIYTGAEWLLSSISSTAGYRSVTGAPGTWVSNPMPGNGCSLAGGAGVVMATTSGGVQYYSTNGGVSWTAMADGYSGFAAFRGRGYCVSTADPTKMLVWDGTRWTKQALPSSAAGFTGLLVIRDVLYLIAGGTIRYTTDGLVWKAGGSGASTLSAAVRSGSRALQCDFIPSTDTTPSVSNYAKWHLLQSTSDTEGSVTMHATKPGEEDILRTLMVYKGLAPRVVYVASADPAILPVPSTSDGKALSFGSVTAKVTADGQEVTDLGTVTWSTTYLTPASGTGKVCTITGMLDAQMVGYIDWQWVRAGYDVVTGRTEVRKVLGDTPSGPRVSRVYTAINTNGTYAALRIGADGWWYTRLSSGGAWVAQDRWVVGVAPSSFWLKMLTPTEGALTSGTVDTWVQCNADRDFVYSNSTPGTYTRTLDLGFNTSATDAGAAWAKGQFRLVVP